MSKWFFDMIQNICVEREREREREREWDSLDYGEKVDMSDTK